MEIRKFKHVKNGKTVYAVIGAESIHDAKEFVYRYKKAEWIDFMANHDACIGTIYKNNLYVGTVSGADKDKIPCIIVYRKTIDVMSYA